MPKAHKKVKGVDAHQHLAGEDWSQAEAWVQELITEGRLDIGPPVLALGVPDQPVLVMSTHWIVLQPDGALDVLTDAQFQDAYDQGGPPTMTVQQ